MTRTGSSRPWLQAVVLLGALLLICAVPMRSVFLAAYSTFWIVVAGVGLCRAPAGGGGAR